MLMKENIDEDLLNLVTKRFNSRRVYSPHSLNAFNRLLKLAGYGMNDNAKSYRSKKTMLQNNNKFYYDNDQLFDRLDLLVAENKAGNHGKALHNEVDDILSALHARTLIETLDHKEILDSLM